MTDDSNPPITKTYYESTEEFLNSHRVEKIWIDKETAGRKNEIAIYRDLDTGELWGRWIAERSEQPYVEVFRKDLALYLKKTAFHWITPEEAQKKRAQEIELKLIEDERYVELEKKFCETYPDELTQHRILTDILTKKKIFVSPIRNDWARRWGIEIWAGVESKTFFD